ncbi:MAG: AAA family ATPase [Gammaproteobacteria bacterium]|nr:AAA family ATPase [Gammaproteobacteria bacterium]
MYSDHALRPIDFRRSKELTYIVYADFNGVTLAHLSKGLSLTAREIIQIAINLINALEDVHRQNLVHRNISPKNILVNRETLEIKLSDFRYSVRSFDKDSVLSKDEARDLYLNYISPELTGRLMKSVDYRSDYYSLGIILYELIVGRTPFESEDPLEIIHGHIARKPAKPYEICSDKCPEAVSAIILKLIEKMPESRYQSIAGIRHDLNRCISELDKKNKITPFLLAECDFSLNFSFTEKLYGRSEELDKIRRILDGASNGSGGFLSVAGSGGSGKTSLVQAAMAERTEMSLFLYGKFEQYGSGASYTAFIRIVERLIDFLLGESKKSFQIYKNEIINSMGSGVAVIADLVPEFVKIVGKQKPPVVVGDVESKNRFQSAFSALLGVFAYANRPLIMVVDDLQWADVESISLLESIVDSKWLSKSLVVGCYRPKAVAEDSSFSFFIKNKCKNMAVDEIVLGNITANDITSLVKDILNTEDVGELSQYIYSMTNGNPYYARQLISNMYQERKIWVDFKKNKWQWSIDGQGEIEKNNGVLSLVLSTMEQMTKDQIETLYFGFCFGNGFTATDIAAARNIEVADVIKHLSIMTNRGYLIHGGEAFEFAHDRVQQAIELRIEAAMREEIHFAIAKMLVSGLKGDPYSRVLEVVKHYNQSESKIRSDEDLSNYLILNYMAAVNALKNSAYSSALRYAERACGLNIDQNEEFVRRFGLKSRMLLARCQYLNAQYSNAKTTINKCIEGLESFNQKARCYTIYKNIVISEGGNYRDVLDMGLLILQQEGLLSMDGYSDLNELTNELEKETRRIFKAKSMDDLLNYEELIDEEKVSQIGILADVWEAAYYASDDVSMRYTICQSVLISMESGVCSESAFGYVLYGMMLTLDEEYESAFALGCLAVEINNRFNDKIMLPKVTNLFCNYVSFHVRPFEESARLYEISLRTGMENGDYLFGLWAGLFSVWSGFLAGENLADLDERASELRLFVIRTNDTKIIYAFDMLVNIIESLRGCDPGFVEVELQSFDRYLAYWKDNRFIPGAAWHAILMGQYHCFMGDYESAFTVMSSKDIVLSPGIIMFPHTQYKFFKNLSLFKMIGDKKIKLTREYEIELDDAINSISRWAYSCPDNFLFQKFLLEAERDRLNNDYWGAANNYKNAITSANASGIAYAVAMCSDLASYFWAEQANSAFADLYYNDARSQYATWGARRKVDLMMPHTNEVQCQADSHVGVDFNEANESCDIGKVLYESELDFYSVVKLTQVISEQVDSDRLLNKAMEIVMENAGADRGALILVEDEQLKVGLKAALRSSYVIEKINVPIDEYDGLLKRVVRYVSRAREMVLVDDALHSEAYENDEYIRKYKIRSILCLPVQHKNELKAILYLENRSVSGVFDESRANILRILLVQMSISLQNVQLYEALENELIKHKETTEALIISENRLQLSHEYAGVGAWEWDIVSKDLYWSKNIHYMIGDLTESIVPSYESFMSITLPEDRKAVEDAIEDCFNGKEYFVEHRIRRQDGEVRWMLEEGGVTRNDNGEPVRMLGIVKDITDRKIEEGRHRAVEKQLMQAQKMEAIGQLTGGIAHDFNNILASILGYSGLLQDQLESLNNVKLNGYLGEVIASGERAANLVSQMLAFSRGDNAKAESINIIDEVKASIRMMSSTMPSSIKISFNHEADIPSIEVNSIQLNQVIMNICINARDSMGDHGRIDLFVKYHDKLSLSCSSCHAPFSGKYVELMIKDNAGGVPADICDSIFDPFFTTKEVGKGTGMGLSMVHGIMHGAQGHIVLDVDEGVGSSFRLLLPVATNQAEDNPEIADNNSGRRFKRGYKILVVDDEAALAEFTSELLTMYGCDVAVCTDSVTARAIMHDDPDGYDLLITDQTMPDITGAELAKMILAVKPEFPVILCTGYSSSINEEIVRQIGIKCLLRKPFTSESLINAIGSLLE